MRLSSRVCDLCCLATLLLCTGNESITSSHDVRSLESSRLAAMLLQDVRRAVLPVLAKLLSDDSVREHVPHVLAELLKESTELQATAADADAVPKLALLLQQENCSLRLKVQNT